MSYDFSNKPELTSLAGVVQALDRVASPMGADFFLMGAAARDLMLTYAHGIEARRGTEDADFGVLVRDWATYESLREALIKSGEFKPRAGSATPKLRHRGGASLDILPFGGVERADRTLAWPPNGEEVFDCFGMSEASGDCLPVRLPEGVVVRVASVPSQTILKIAAWSDRKHSHPERDAGDLFLFLKHYLNLGNMDHAAQNHADLFEIEPFDSEEAGVRLLARDLCRLMDAQATRRVIDILVPEADQTGPLLLASQSDLELEHARRLIEVLCDELVAVQTSNGTPA